MKKILLKKIFPMLLTLVLLFSAFAVSVSAEGGKTTMSFSDKYPAVGDTFTVTLRYFELDESATSIHGELSYDTSIFKYISTNAEGDVQNSNGVVKFVSPLSASNEAFIKVDFEVIGNGSCRITLSNATAASDNGDTNIPGSAASVTTKEAGDQPSQNTNGENAALNSLSVPVGELIPAFSPEITEYRVTVPYTQKDGIISCESKDPSATISVSGSRELAVGITTRTLTVVASDGSRRDYVIHFNRLDENGNDTTVPVGGGITFNVNGKEYHIGTVGVGTIPPIGFYLSTVTIDGTEVSAYKDSSGKAVLLYLIASDSSDEGLFLYVNGEIYNFHYINAGGNIYIIKDIDANASVPSGMVKSTYVINGKEVTCFKYTDVAYADFVVFSTISPKGNTGYYSYDVNENTMQRIVKFVQTKAAPVQTQEAEVSKATKTIIMMLVIVFAMLLILLIVALVVKMGKKHGKNLGRIFEVEEEYEMESSSDTPDDKF